MTTLTAAIRLLKNVADLWASVGDRGTERFYRNAICVLEEAEKVDRVDALRWFKLLDDHMIFPNEESLALLRQKISALIEALPEKE